MLIRPYNPEKDRIELIHVLVIRGMSPDLVNDLPEHGLIAIEADTLIAAGFIRRIEGMDCFLDSYITRPAVNNILRDRALNLITTKLIKLAKANNVRNLYAFSADYHTQIRAGVHGFVDLKNHLFQALRLN